VACSRPLDPKSTQSLPTSVDDGSGSATDHDDDDAEDDVPVVSDDDDVEEVWADDF